MTVNSFEENINKIKELLSSTCEIDISIENYDGYVIKQLAATNTLSKNKPGHQTHIAITGNGRNLFPFIPPIKYDVLEAEVGTEAEAEAGNRFFKPFIFQAPMKIYKKNCDYISNGLIDFGSENVILENFSIYPRPQGSKNYQVQLIRTKVDGKNLNNIMTALHPGDYLIVLKRSQILEYDFFFIKEQKNISETFGKNNMFGFNRKIIDKKPIILNRNNVVKTNSTKQPLNQILFGPAGTGKTYHTINRALKILDPSMIDELDSNDNNYDRETLNIKFKDFIEKGQVKFITFHQSFSYEDFIEGIRAESFETETDDGKKIRTLDYPVKDGIFLELCKSATTKVIKNIFNDIDNVMNSQHWKMSLGKAGYEEDIYQYCINNNCILLGWGENLNFSDCKNYKEIEDYMKANGYREYLNDYPSSALFVHNFKNVMKLGDLVIASDGNYKFRAIGKITGDYEFLEGENEELPDFRQMRKVQWLRQYTPSLPNDRLLKTDKNFSMHTLYKLAHIDSNKLSELLAEDSIDDFNEKNFVIIIDEINRGNISKIFGELITLIEDDKRQGQSEEISVTLPYSKTKFSVPNNVYIIGTMNSSDRSLTGIDVALRRRFTFIEMPPKPKELEIEIEGVNLCDLLSKINRRIEVLLDKEHCIGHANFMSLNHESSIQDLAYIFKRKVLPLLQEYFFDDWSKINMIFNNNGMVTKEQISIDKLFTKIDKDDLNYYENSELWNINDSAFEDVQSYLTIIE